MDKLVCLGKNYLDHAGELGDAVPEKPVLFLKPPSCLVTVPADKESTLPLPRDQGAVHYECEIVLRIDRGGHRLSLIEAERAIGAVSLGLDLTLRDRQAEAKRNGWPWETSKAFPSSAILGPWREGTEREACLCSAFSFSLDGVVRQTGTAAQMRLSPAECVQYASEHFVLCPGDLIYTGTPAGVGGILPGQVGEARWPSLAYSVRWI